MRNVESYGRRITAMEVDGIFDHSFQDEPVGLSDAQINRLPRTKPTRSQINSLGNFNRRNYKIITYNDKLQIPFRLHDMYGDI